MGCSGSHSRNYSYSDAKTFHVSRTITTQTPVAINPDFSFNISKQHKNYNLESLQNPYYNWARLGVADSASISLQNTTNDRLCPTRDRVGKEHGNKDLTIHPYQFRSHKKLIKTRFITDVELTTVLSPVSQDEDIKAVNKGQINYALPAANHNARNQQRARTTSLPSLEWMVTPLCERYPVSLPVDREQKSTQPQLNVIVNDDWLLETYPSNLPDDEKQSQTTLEPSSSARKSWNDTNCSTSTTSTIGWQDENETWEVLIKCLKHQSENSLSRSKEFCEKLKNVGSLSETLSTISFSKPRGSLKCTETPHSSICVVTGSYLDGWAETSQIFENGMPGRSAPDTHEEEVGMITRNIHQFELKIDETKTKIRELRLASVNILTSEMSEMASNRVSSWLEIEQKICQLEDKSQGLENKRQEAVSRLQNKMMENIWDKELPLLSIHMPTGLSASTSLESQAAQSSFDAPTTETHSENEFREAKI